MTPVSGILACLFDAYGALFDFASAAARSRGVSDDKRAALTAFERILSVDAPKTFKTDPTVYTQALDVLGLDAEHMCFCSSNGWDAYAASDFGMRVAWINRRGQRAERLPGEPDLVLGSLGELPALLTAPS